MALLMLLANTQVIAPDTPSSNARGAAPEGEPPPKNGVGGIRPGVI